MMDLSWDDKKKKKVPMKIVFRGKKVKGMPPNCCGRTVAINHDDSMIVVGMKGGHVWVIECDREKPDLGWKKIKTLKYAKRWISCIEFSPNDEMCAIGDHQ